MAATRVDGIPSSLKQGGRFHNYVSDDKIPVWKYVTFLFTMRPPPPADLAQRLVFTSQCDLDAGPKTGLSAVWLGHACFLVRFPNGFTMVTDPVFDQRAGPMFGLLGPKRLTPPGTSWQQLRDHADAVVISHNHYDHLCVTAARQLCEKTWVVPLGLGQWLEKNGVATDKIRELDWGEAAQVTERGRSVTVTCLPCQHWSRRTMTDTNRSLWASWSIAEQGKANVFFGGDTGYSDVFATVGKVLGPFDLSLIGIGAYAPRHLMKCNHASPEEAVAMHSDLRSRHSVGMHWGTWALSGEEMWEPMHRLRAAVEAKGLPAEEFVTVQIGKWFSVSLRT